MSDKLLNTSLDKKKTRKKKTQSILVRRAHQSISNYLNHILSTSHVLHQQRLHLKIHTKK